MCNCCCYRELYAKAAKERDELRKANKVLHTTVDHLVRALAEEMAEKIKQEGR
jgi:hypothetical protein